MLNSQERLFSGLVVVVAMGILAYFFSHLTAVPSPSYASAYEYPSKFLGKMGGNMGSPLEVYCDFEHGNLVYNGNGTAVIHDPVACPPQAAAR